MNKNRSSRANAQLIVQALNAAETNIRLAKQLLSTAPLSQPSASISPADIPGLLGTFEGTEMVTKEGERFKVNPNYASKSVLVYGDTLKKIEEDGRERFKQVERVKRETIAGVLAKKDGRWVAVTKEGSYAVLPEAVDFQGGKEGSEVVVVIPSENKKAPFAAIESVKTVVVKEPVEKVVVAKRASPAPLKKEAKPKKSVVERVKEKVIKEVEEVKPAPPPTPGGVEDEEELR